jgi:hypothetical protein
MLRAGVQQLHISTTDKDNLTQQQLEVVLAGNDDPAMVQEGAPIRIQAAANEIMSLKQWIVTKQQEFLATPTEPRLVAAGERSRPLTLPEEPVMPAQRSGVGHIVDIGFNQLCGLQQPHEAIARRTRAAAREAEERQRLAGVDVTVAAMEPLTDGQPPKTESNTMITAAQRRKEEDSSEEVVEPNSATEAAEIIEIQPVTEPLLSSADSHALHGTLRALVARRKTHTDDNPTWTQAINGPNSDSWYMAGEVEFGDLERRGQIKRVDHQIDSNQLPMPPWHLFIGLLICCTTKRDSTTGEFKRHKVRAALRGDRDTTQFPGRNDTYSPSGKWSTLFLFVALAAHYGWKLSSLDVTAAFGYNAWDRPYPMYIETNPEHHRDGIRRIYQIMCIMYGLKEASRRFYELMSSWLVERGWKKGRFDPCLFLRGRVHGLLSTDDYLLGTEPGGEEELAQTRAEFKDRFEITVDEEGANYLGIAIRQGGHSIGLSMPTKIAKLRTLVFPDLARDKWPDQPVLEPFLPTWSE